MGVIEYFRLILHGRDNPLLQGYQQPGTFRRRLVFGFVALLLNLVLALFAIQVCGATMGQNGAFVLYGLIAACIAPFLQYLVFFFFSARHVRLENLEEYELSALSRKEVVVGVTTLPVLLSTLLLLPWLLIMTGLMLTQPGMNGGERFVFMLFFAGHLTAGWIFTTAVITRRWLSRPRSIFWLLVTTYLEVAFFVAVTIGLVILQAIALINAGNLNDFEEFGMTLLIIPVLAVTAGILRRCLLHAPNRLFSAIDREGYRQSYWVPNENKDEDEKKLALQALRRAMPSPAARWKAAAIATAIAIGICLLTHTMMHSDKIWRSIVGYPALFGSAIYIPLFYFQLLSRKCGGRLPVVNGYIHGSLFGMSTPLLIFGAAWIMLAIATDWSMDWEDYGILFILMVAALFAIFYTVGLSLLPQRRRKMIAALWLVLALLMHFPPALSYVEWSQDSFIFYESSDFAYTFLGACSFVLVLLVVFLPDYSAQRLHKLELRDMPRLTSHLDCTEPQA